VTKFPFKVFEPYARELETLATNALSGTLASNSGEVQTHLDGYPGTVVRRLISLQARRKAGVFLTGSLIRQRLVAGRDGSYPATEAYPTVDPACGAGDLLIAAAEKLPLKGTLEETLAYWGSVLHGYDLVPQLTRVARARLVLLAHRRTTVSAHSQPVELQECFPHIQHRDGLTAPLLSERPAMVLLNPPFGTLVDERREWGRGLVNGAAVFLDDLLSTTAKSSRLAAVLPDVLRTGSRYERWRSMVEKRGTIKAIERIGRFDPWTNVDVFILRMVIGSTAQVSSPWFTRSEGAKRVGDYFSVHVGPVVPHRHPLNGPTYPYLSTGGLPTSGVVDQVSEYRAFTGKVFRPPFVLIRRTSRPTTSSKRLIAVLVLGNQPMAIENHLLVLIPKDGRADSCRSLLKILEDNSTSNWLNERIRCRHLTVSAIADIPWARFNR
jgi:hypothetical protein